MIEGHRWTRAELCVRKNESRMPMFDYYDAPGREVRIFHSIRQMHRRLLDTYAGVNGPDVGYRRLAIAVIMRAIFDYLNPDAQLKHRREAGTFLLFDESGEAQLWFSILGLDKAVVKRYLQEIERESR